MRKLRMLVDLTSAVLRTHPLTRAQAEEIVDLVRAQVVAWFPGKGAVFDLVHRPRFGRIIGERFGGPEAGPPTGPPTGS